MGLLKTLLILAVFGCYATGEELKSYKCDFEGYLCSFLSNDLYTREDWKIGKGKLKSGNTGLSITDHTHGNDIGRYLYVDFSKSKDNEAKLQTIKLNEEVSIRFFYHIYAADIDYFRVYAESISKLETVDYFVRTKTHKDIWKEAFFSFSTLTPYMRRNGYRIIFSAIRKSSSEVPGHIALDDIELFSKKCENTKRDAFQSCAFDDDACGYAVRQGPLKWEWKSKTQSFAYFKTAPTTDHTLETSMGGYWVCGNSGYSSNAVQTTMLSSPVYGKPEQSSNCLHFYAFLNDDRRSLKCKGAKQLYIKAYLNFPNSRAERKLLVTKGKNITNSGQWKYIEAKAEITDTYQLQFVAGFQTSVQALVAIDDVKLFVGNCPGAGSEETQMDKSTNSPDIPTRELLLHMEMQNDTPKINRPKAKPRRNSVKQSISSAISSAMDKFIEVEKGIEEKNSIFQQQLIELEKERNSLLKQIVEK